MQLEERLLNLQSNQFRKFSLKSGLAVGPMEGKSAAVSFITANCTNFQALYLLTMSSYDKTSKE